MKTVKLVLIIGCIFLGSQILTAQKTTSLESVARERITTLTAKINLNLNQEQESKLFNTFLTRESKLQTLKKSKLSKREIGQKIAEIDIEFLNNLQSFLSDDQWKKLVQKEESLNIQ